MTCFHFFYKYNTLVIHIKAFHNELLSQAGFGGRDLTARAWGGVGLVSFLGGFVWCGGFFWLVLFGLFVGFVSFFKTEPMK